MSHLFYLLCALCKQVKGPRSGKEGGKEVAAAVLLLPLGLEGGDGGWCQPYTPTAVLEVHDCVETTQNGQPSHLNENNALFERSR